MPKRTQEDEAAPGAPFNRLEVEFPTETTETAANQLAIAHNPCEMIRADKRFASVAQLAEQLTLNQLVLGSSPSRGTNFKPSARSHFTPAGWPEFGPDGAAKFA